MASLKHFNRENDTMWEILWRVQLHHKDSLSTISNRRSLGGLIRYIAFDVGCSCLIVDSGKDDYTEDGKM